MIHARGRAWSRKINYISKVKIEFGWRGAFVFARRRSSSLPSSTAPYSWNGRNFKRKFTNEGDFPRTPSPPLCRQEEDEMKEEQGEERRLRRGKSHGAFPQPFSALHHQRMTRDFLGVSFPFFFNLLNSRAVTANCSREKWDTTVPTKILLPICRDRNCFKRSFAKYVPAYKF